MNQKHRKQIKTTIESRLLGFDKLCGDAILADDVDDSAPTRKHVPVAGRSQNLVKFERKFFSFHVWLVVSLADGHKFL